MIATAKSDTIHSKALPDLVAKLLAERQQVLVLFNRLVEMNPFTVIAPVQPLLQQLCQVVVDYVALGHFEVFQSLEDDAEDSEHCRRVKALAREIYPAIADTTTAAIDFNDRYDCGDQCEDLNSLSTDLSLLGEQLATRVELEDRLLAALKLPRATAE
jgi:regulator of sigma D